MNNVKPPNEEVLFELLALTCVISNRGTKRYYNEKGVLHKIHGPAVIWADGTQYWYKEGKIHREDGPAYIDLESGREEYWIDNNHLTKKQFIQWQKDNGK